MSNTVDFLTHRHANVRGSIHLDFQKWIVLFLDLQFQTPFQTNPKSFFLETIWISESGKICSRSSPSLRYSFSSMVAIKTEDSYVTDIRRMSQMVDFFWNFSICMQINFRPKSTPTYTFFFQPLEKNRGKKKQQTYFHTKPATHGKTQSWGEGGGEKG